MSIYQKIKLVKNKKRTYIIDAIKRIYYIGSFSFINLNIKYKKELT